jgi:hypothetical protein
MNAEGRKYASLLSSLLTSSQRKVFRKLSSPNRIQDYLDHLPANFELSGETNFSAVRVLSEKRAHCLEGAVFAAAVLAYHGHRPYLMDFQTAYDDEDHVIALVNLHGHWGAISKTNHSVLRFRDAIYSSPRELAMSYVHEYFMWDGRKSLRAYSRPFDMSKYHPSKWVTAGEDLHWLPEAIDKSPHYPILPTKNFNLRRVSKIEIFNMKSTEWNRRGTKNNFRS